MDFIGTMDVIKARKGQWKTPVKKTSPNDVKRVVWATAERQQQQQRLHITTGRSVTTKLPPTWHDVALERRRGFGDDENGPKRCQMRHLGHW